MAVGCRKLGRPALAGVNCRGENGHPTHAYKLARQVEIWGDRFTPPCACGCGEPVRMNEKGPGKYVNRQHVLWGRDSARNAIGDDVIEVKVFREACEKIRKDKGWSIRELANRGGWHKGHLSQYLYDYRVGPNPKVMKRELAVSFLRRCAGLAEPPTAKMVREEMERQKKLRAWDRDNNRKGRSS